MSEKKIDVFYKAPGKSEWERVEQARVNEGARAVRRAARALLAEADAEAGRLIATARPAAGLTPVEAFEREMARELGAWRRYLEVEVRRFGRSAEVAIEELIGKKP